MDITNAEILTTELRRLHARLDTIERKLDAQNAPVRELMAEMGPIGKEVMAAATDTLGEMEKKGYFEFGREGLGIIDKVVTSYSAEDVRALGENIVKILDVIRASTQPEVLDIMAEAADTLTHPESLEPIGVMGMMRAGRDEDVQRGMAMMFELLRQIGRGAKVVSEVRTRPPSPQRSPQATPQAPPPRDVKAAKLSAMLAPSRARAPSCEGERAPAVQATPKAGVVTVPGYAYTADGFLVDPTTWTPEFATALAAAMGCTLGDAQWTLVQFARTEFVEHGASPNIRRLTTGTGLSTKEIYALFSKAPGKTISRLAGIPKPAGCI